MSLFIGIFGILSVLFGLIFSLTVLNAKPIISQAFFTDEQKLKVYLFNLVMFSFILSLMGAAIFLALKDLETNGQTGLNTQVFGEGLGIAIITFIISIFIVDRLSSLVQNFRIKHHHKFRVNIPSVGTVYIIGMLDKETCICSKDPNLSFKGIESTKESYLIPKADIMMHPLVITKHIKPEKRFLNKLIE